MADRLQLMVEAERRGILPPDKVALLAEARKRGLVQSDSPQSMPAAPSMGGMGGFNPMARRLMGGAQAITEAAGITPENSSNPIANAAGIGEFIPQAVTGTAGTIAGGIAGIGQGIKNLVSPGMPAADRVQQVQQAMTYQPRTGAGAGMSRAVGAPGEIWQAGTNRAGEFVTDVTGSPALGAAVKTAGDVVPAVVGARAAPKRGPRQPARTETYQRPPEPGVPTSADLAEAKTAAYKAAENAGVVIRPESTKRVVDLMDLVAKKENLGKLPTKLKEARDVLAARIEANEPLSLMDADKVRQLIGDAYKSTDPADRRLATIVKNRYDDYLTTLKESDTLAGNSADGVAQLEMARGLFRRMRNSEMIDQAIKTAERKGQGKYSQAGVEHALRQEFEKIAKRDDKRKFLSKEERAAIDRVVAPGAAANVVRGLGKFDPSTGGMGTALGVITGSALSPVTGGASMLLPAVGFGASRLATRTTRKNVDAAREALVGRGVPNAAQRATAPPTQSTGAGTAASGSQGVRAATTRAPEAIQSDIQRLLADAQNVPPGPLGAARMAAIELRLALLERELSAQDAPQQGAR